MVRRVLAALTLTAAVVTTVGGCGKASPTKSDTPPPAGGFKDANKGTGGEGGKGERAVNPPPPPPPPPP
ncbi:MAG: hypothetical protein U0804_09230 [Gemmataceae bacterium]